MGSVLKVTNVVDISQNLTFQGCTVHGISSVPYSHVCVFTVLLLPVAGN